MVKISTSATHVHPSNKALFFLVQRLNVMMCKLIMPFYMCFDTYYQKQRCTREGYSERKEAKEERTSWTSTRQGTQVIYDSCTRSWSSLHMNTSQRRLHSDVYGNPGKEERCLTCLTWPGCDSSCPVRVHAMADWRLAPIRAVGFGGTMMSSYWWVSMGITYDTDFHWWNLTCDQWYVHMITSYWNI